MKLNHLTDKTLLTDTKKLVIQERKSTLEILHHIKEIDRRKLYSDLKYSSLFDYCVKDLGYSEGAAQRRIVAARLLVTIPEIGKKIESGALSLTNISQVNQFFKEPEEKKAALEAVEGMTKKQCEKTLFGLSGHEPAPPREKQKRISKESVQVAIVLKDETLALMEKVKGMMGGKSDADEVVRYAMEAAMEKILKEKFKQTQKPKSPPPAKVGKYVQAYVKREVFKKDGKCSNCGSIHNLNYDHIKAYALGGSSSIENIRLLCFNCNQRSRLRARL